MADKIILAIKPKFVEKILDGTKKYEFRKRVPKREIDEIYIYESYPVKKVVGKVKVNKIFCDSPNNIWLITKKYSGTDKNFFDNYFANKSIAYAFELGSIELYDEPVSLKSLGVNYAPQSYIYYKK